jgi:uncharacterized NAD-dependent epimerase/dehydratase family protein
MKIICREEIMSSLPEGNAIIYSENAFNSPLGKSVNSLIKFTERYRVLSVIDSNYQSQDAGYVLNGQENGIKIFSTFKEAFNSATNPKQKPTHLIIGFNPTDNELEQETREVIKSALKKGLNVDSLLHEFLTDDKELKSLAAQNNATIRDIRKTPSKNNLHPFSGKIEEVDSFIIIVAGTDSYLGKRTTACHLTKALIEAGYKAEFIGTGATSWMQGAKYSIILDSLVKSSVSGEIENIIYSAWKNEKPNFIIIEGPSGMSNPANPNGFELLVTARPDIILLQHSPLRKDYINFPDFSVHPLSKQMKAIEALSGKQVVAININHQNLSRKEIDNICNEYAKLYDIPTFDILTHGIDKLVKVVLKYKK